MARTVTTQFNNREAQKCYLKTYSITMASTVWLGLRMPPTGDEKVRRFCLSSQVSQVKFNYQLCGQSGQIAI